MDRFIASMMPVEEDGDLMLCRDHGVAYQRDQSALVAYDESYFQKCAAYDQEIARKVNAGRIVLVDKYVGRGSVVDVGVGSGDFIKARPNTWGHDVNPTAVEWLKSIGKWAESINGFSAVTMFDVIEHVPEPESYFRQIPLHGFLFCSLPVFYGLGGIRTSKHYRPGEHLYYFSDEGFERWMVLHGFMLLERDDFEIQAGRESIYSFAFKRYRWPK